MVRIGQHDFQLLAAYLAVVAVLYHLTGGDDQVVFAQHNLIVDHLLAVVDVYVKENVAVGVVTVKAAHNHGHFVAGHAIVEAEADRARKRVLQSFEFSLSGVQEFENLLGVGQILLAVLSEFYFLFPGAADKKRHAELVLQLVYCIAERRLRDEKVFRGHSKAAVLAASRKYLS